MLRVARPRHDQDTRRCKAIMASERSNSLSGTLGQVMLLHLAPQTRQPTEMRQRHTTMSPTHQRTAKARTEAVATMTAMPRTMIHRGAACQSTVAAAGKLSRRGGAEGEDAALPTSRASSTHERRLC